MLKTALRTVTVLIVLGVALLGVELYRMAQGERDAQLSVAPGGAPDRAAVGEFSPLATPRPAPDVTLAALSGGTQSLAALRGRVVLVNFWATWCAPCVKEMPSLLRLQTARGDIAVLAVSEDRRGAALVEPFIAKHGLEKLPIYLDPENSVGHAFGIDGLPTTALIDREGRIVGRLEGAAQWDSADMLKLIRRYAGTPNGTSAG